MRPAFAVRLLPPAPLLSGGVPPTHPAPVVAPAPFPAAAQSAPDSAAIAKQHHIRVVLSPVLPVFDYPWKRGLEPAPKIVALDTWMKRYAADVGETYLGYHTAMSDARSGPPPAPPQGRPTQRR